MQGSLPAIAIANTTLGIKSFETNALQSKTRSPNLKACYTLCLIVAVTSTYLVQDVRRNHLVNLGNRTR
ncbi:hypothetical protein [Nostoc sp.]|uniref:hypothetical protein n=1 Tax=Nostoc sp. TaxID=1180 RepID=UPI002FFD3B5C